MLVPVPALATLSSSPSIKLSASSSLLVSTMLVLTMVCTCAWASVESTWDSEGSAETSGIVRICAWTLASVETSGIAGACACDDNVWWNSG